GCGAAISSTIRRSSISFSSSGSGYTEIPSKARASDLPQQGAAAAWARGRRDRRRTVLRAGRRRHLERDLDLYAYASLKPCTDGRVMFCHMDRGTSKDVAAAARLAPDSKRAPH